MGDFHACVFEGYQGYFSQKTGRVKLGQTIFPDIKTAIKYLMKK